MPNVREYKPGDRVRHHNGAIGTVRRIITCRFKELGEAVEVEFGPIPNKPGQKWPYPRRNWFGEFPQNWIDQFGLDKISN